MTADGLIERLRAELAGRQPRRAEPGTFEAEAAVVFMLRSLGRGLQFLAIRRTEDERDPWSGHMALPGGRREAGDDGLWGTAVRETHEEVGIDLTSSGRLLGQLDDVSPRSRRIPAIAITPFIVAVDPNVEARTSSEVDHAVWLPLDVVVDEVHRGSMRLDVVPDREFPTIEYDGHVIWGLTLSILRQVEELLKRIGYPGEAGA